jgi:hypothetical protein
VLRIQDCTGLPAQSWALTSQALTSGRIVGFQGRCLQVDDADTAQEIVRLGACGAGNSQAWLRTGDGTVRSMTRCLDVVDGGTADLTPVGLWECNGNEAQQWVTRPDGALVNPVSDKCLDAGTNGNDMVLKQCSGALSQRWALLARSA